MCENRINMEFEKIEKKVLKALKMLYEKDLYLFKKRVHERSISHKLGEYFQIFFTDWNVDCEYNKLGDFEKLLARSENCSSEEEGIIYPDIIVHKRGPDGPNLMVLEMKKTLANDPCDVEKLSGLTDAGRKYNYQWGLFIHLNYPNLPRLRWFADGSEEEALETPKEKLRFCLEPYLRGDNSD